jgi:ubiquinone biosynthesis protein UbiJ
MTNGLSRNLEIIRRVAARAHNMGGSADPAVRALASEIADLARATAEALSEVERTAETAEMDARRARRFAIR